VNSIRNSRSAIWELENLAYTAPGSLAAGAQGAPTPPNAFLRRWSFVLEWSLGYKDFVLGLGGDEPERAHDVRWAHPRV
jgi:hypothetical protein